MEINVFDHEEQNVMMFRFDRQDLNSPLDDRIKLNRVTLVKAVHSKEPSLDLQRQRKKKKQKKKINHDNAKCFMSLEKKTSSNDQA